MNRESASESGSRVRLGQVAEFNLGAMRVDPARRQIQVNDETRTLEPRVMQVLVALAEARPSVVPRDELAEACWGGIAVGDDAINRCIVSLRRLAREFDPEPFEIETVPRVGYALRQVGGTENASAPEAGRPLTPRRRRYVLPLAILGLALAAIAAWLWKPWEADGLSVSVASATLNPDSQNLARDLTAKLGMLNSVREGSVRLLDRGSGKADFRFQVDSVRQGSDIATNLVFLNSQREVLWSQNFRQPSANLADLERQLATTTGKVLDCAVETRAEGDELKPETVKAYLNACAAFADANERSLKDLEAALTQITRAAPKFWPAWRKRLLIEAQLVDYSDRSPECLALARQALAAAVRANPALPEIDIVRAAILPTRAFAERSRLIESAWKRSPNDPNMLSFYAGNLSRVGRISDAIDAQRRAVQLDPLSPTNREGLIMNLAMVGRLAEAKEELRQAERLWPGSLAILGTRYLFYLRVGDPKEAIRLIDSGQEMPSSAPYQRVFLEARANPTPANVKAALDDARAKYASHWQWIYHTAQALGEFGREDELFGILLNWNHPEGVDYVTDILFRPSLHEFRRDPRFMRIAQRTGLLDYWQKSGKWPDFCYEPDLPYDCKAEAAKLRDYR